MRAVITGASGLLGGNLAAVLVEQGHSVAATRRAGSRVGHLDGLPITWLEADLSDTGALARAFAGADAVFHCAALVSNRPRPTPELVAANVDGTANVLQAVRSSGARLLYCSSAVTIGVSEDGQPCTEASRWNLPEHGLADGYSVTKKQAEERVQAAAQDGLDAVIVCPTYMFGPYDSKPSSGKMLVELAHGRMPFYSSGRNNFVGAADVARGMVLALERGRRGGRYLLGGDNLTYKELFDRAAALAGARPPRIAAPRALARLLGWAGDLQDWATGKEPLINTASVAWGYCDTFQSDSGKARAELGYAPGPLDDAIRAAYAWFRGQGMI